MIPSIELLQPESLSVRWTLQRSSASYSTGSPTTHPAIAAALSGAYGTTTTSDEDVTVGYLRSSTDSDVSTVDRWHLLRVPDSGDAGALGPFSLASMETILVSGGSAGGTGSAHRCRIVSVESRASKVPFRMIITVELYNPSFTLLSSSTTSHDVTDGTGDIDVMVECTQAGFASVWVSFEVPLLE
jgi:hypothetical protein